MSKTTLNMHTEWLALESRFSPDILAFLNSISESQIRRLITRFQRESTSTGSKASNALEAYALLENNPVSQIRENSTQLLREIRGEHAGSPLQNGVRGIPACLPLCYF